ncbi:hypothetical protein LOTGIDRAFT_109191, partial [Lottia gigantea]
DGGWSDWSEYAATGSCSTTCGNGTLTEQRNRTCNNPATSGGGTPCSGSTRETRTVPCFVRECPINGGFGEWGNWTRHGACSVTCGEGLIAEKRNRSCDNPEPRYGGEECVGQSEEGRSVECSMAECNGWYC